MKIPPFRIRAADGGIKRFRPRGSRAILRPVFTDIALFLPRKNLTALLVALVVGNPALAFAKPGASFPDGYTVVIASPDGEAFEPS